MQITALLFACVAYAGHGLRVRITGKFQSSPDDETKTVSNPARDSEVPPWQVSGGNVLHPLTGLAVLVLVSNAAVAAFTPAHQGAPYVLCVPSAKASQSAIFHRHLGAHASELNSLGSRISAASMCDDGRPGDAAGWLRAVWSPVADRLRKNQQDLQGIENGTENGVPRLFYFACSQVGNMTSQEAIIGNVLIPPHVHLRPGCEHLWLEEHGLRGQERGGLTNLRLPVNFTDLQALPREMEKTRLEEFLKTHPEEFTLKQYNVLAARMGDNSKPWMLQGADVSREQRDAIWEKFDNQNPSWKDELSDQQWEQVRLWNEQVFDWSSRKHLLLREMFADNPDILTLQELDKHKVFFEPAFRERNYGDVYAQRVDKQDGVAIVFNKSRYQLLARSDRFYLPNEKDHIPLHQPGSGITVSDEVKDVIMQKAKRLRWSGGYGELGCRIALFALLQDRTNPQRKLMIGTTHLDKSPDNPLKSLSRINQMSVLNIIQGQLARQWQVSLDRDFVIFAGDFNTDKEDATMVTQPALAGGDHRLTEMSVQPSTDGCTSLTEDRKMWIDYIFHAGQAEVAEASACPCPGDPMPNLDQPSDHFPLTARFRWVKEDTTGSFHRFAVPTDYDYSCSTEENYAATVNDETLFGDYVEFRKRLDYSYHRFYREERQLLQDRIVAEFLHPAVRDSYSGASCETPVNNWIVYTAGGMGAGKSHTMRWLHNHSFFPLESFVYVDPDQIRSRLPERNRYVEMDASTCGFLTQKESGYIAEILQEVALHQGKNILIDGSLRDYEWNLEQFKEFRQQGKKIAIIHVHASDTTQYERAAKRAKKTGRVVPDDILLETAELIPKSLSMLKPHTDFFASIENEGAEPILTQPENMTWEDFSLKWLMECPIDPFSEAASMVSGRGNKNRGEPTALGPLLHTQEDLVRILK